MLMKKIFIALTLIALLETACVPTMLVGGGAVTGAAIGRDSRTLQTMSDDVDIEFQAGQKLKDDAVTAKGTNISVTSFNRIVLLVGQVPSESIRARAEADVQTIGKVRRVYNLLKVAPLEGIMQLADDSRIEANVKARMTLASDLNSNNFKIVVENKVVYLMGYTTHEQAERALNVVRNSSGVVRLVNLIEYKSTDDEVAPKPASTEPERASEQAKPVNNAATPVPEPLKFQAEQST
jgi:osmotically-inducible protein OsmY